MCVVTPCRSDKSKKGASLREGRGPWAAASAACRVPHTGGGCSAQAAAACPHTCAPHANGRCLCTSGAMHAQCSSAGSHPNRKGGLGCGCGCTPWPATCPTGPPATPLPARPIPCGSAFSLPRPPPLAACSVAAHTALAHTFRRTPAAQLPVPRPSSWLVSPPRTHTPTPTRGPPFPLARWPAAGIIPNGHLSDGRMYLVIVSKCNHLNYLRFLIRLSTRGLSDRCLPFVRVIPITELRLRCVRGARGCLCGWWWWWGVAADGAPALLPARTCVRACSLGVLACCCRGSRPAGRPGPGPGRGEAGFTF